MTKAIRKIKRLDNSLQHGQIFYGLHMSEGIAHYKPPGETPFTVFVGERTLKLMNSSFPGKPVYVGHVDDHDDLGVADGVVSDSFYNKADGKHWCKFVVTTQKGLDAINRGWKLSNSFLVNQQADGGCWHGHDYDKTVAEGEYHHLAIVPDPRYAESIILTPSEFKKYNNEKEAELLMLANSKEKEMKFQLFKKAKVENSKEFDIEGMSIILPKSKKEMTLEQLVNEMDEAVAAPTFAETEIEVGGTKMTVTALIKMYTELKAAFDELEIIEEEVEEAVEDDAEEVLSNSADEEEIDEDELDSDDEESEEEEEVVIQNSKDKKTLTPAQRVANIKKLKNASDKGLVTKASTAVDLSSDMVRRGSSRYGSSK